MVIVVTDYRSSLWLTIMILSIIGQPSLARNQAVKVTKLNVVCFIEEPCKINFSPRFHCGQRIEFSDIADVHLPKWLTIDYKNNVISGVPSSELTRNASIIIFTKKSFRESELCGIIEVRIQVRGKVRRWMQRGEQNENIRQRRATGKKEKKNKDSGKKKDIIYASFQTSSVSFTQSINSTSPYSMKTPTIHATSGTTNSKGETSVLEFGSTLSNDHSQMTTSKATTSKSLTETTTCTTTNSRSFGGLTTSQSFGETTPSQSFGKTTPSPSFGETTPSQSSGKTTPSQSFGESTTSQSFGESTTSQSFGESTTSQSFGESTPSQSFGESTTLQSFGESTPSQSFGESTTLQSFGESTTSQSFGESTTSQSFGESTTLQSFGETTTSQSFGETTTSQSFGETTTSSSVGETTKILVDSRATPSKTENFSSLSVSFRSVSTSSSSSKIGISNSHSRKTTSTDGITINLTSSSGRKSSMNPSAMTTSSKGTGLTAVILTSDDITSTINHDTRIQSRTSILKSSSETSVLSRLRETPSLSQYHETPSLSKHHETPSLSWHHETLSLSKHHETPSLSKHHETPSLSKHHETSSLSKHHETLSLSKHHETLSLSKHHEIPSLSPHHETPFLSQHHETPSLSKHHETPSLSQHHETASNSSTGITSSSHTTDFSVWKDTMNISRSLEPSYDSSATDRSPTRIKISQTTNSTISTTSSKQQSSLATSKSVDHMPSLTLSEVSTTVTYVPAEQTDQNRRFCPDDDTDTTMGNLHWPKTMHGRIASLTCPCNCTANITRKCSYDGDHNIAVWKHFDATSCFCNSENIAIASLLKLKVNASNVLRTSEDILLFSNPGCSLGAKDITNIAIILERIISMKNESNQFADNVLKTLDNVLEARYEAVAESQRDSNSSSRFVDLCTRLLEAITFPGKTFHRDERNFVIAVSLVDLSENISGISYPDNTATALAMAGKRSKKSSLDATIHLPPELFNHTPPRNKSKTVIFILYKSTKFFHDGSTTAVLSSLVIAGSVKHYNVRHLTQPVVITFKQTVKKEGKPDVLCSFWDFGKSGWSNDGCVYHTTLNDGRIVCHCNHLTNFAVLMDVNFNEIETIHDEVLSVITYVGCSLSFIGLVLTIVTILTFKDLHSKRPNQILLNLCIALTATLIIFVCAAERQRLPSLLACRVAAMALHYFILVTFLWMAIEAFNMYMAFVQVIHKPYSRFLLKSCIMTWGLPALIVAITSAISFDKYGGEKYCRLHGTPFFVTFFAPIIFILLANTVIFIIVLRALLSSTNTVDSVKKRKRLRMLRRAVSILILLGLTWVFGVVAVDEAKLVFQYLFCICNPLQGIFIFLFNCVLPKTTRAKYKELFAAHSTKDKSPKTKSIDDGGKSSRSLTRSNKVSTL